MRSRLIIALLALTLAGSTAGCTVADRGAAPQTGPATPAAAPPLLVAAAGRQFAVGADAATVAFGIDGRHLAVGTREALVVVDTVAGTTTPVPETTGVRRVVALPGGGFRALAGDAVVTVADPPGTAGTTGATARSTTWLLPGAGADLAVLADGTTAVTLPDRGQVVLLDPSGATDRTLAVPGRPTSLAPAGGSGVGGSPPRLGVVDPDASSLFVFRTDTGALEEALRAGDGASTAVGDAAGRIIVVDTRDGEILVFTTGPLVMRQRHPTPGAPYATAYDPVRRRLWVTLTGRNEVVGYDVSGGAPKEFARHPTVRQPDGVAVDPTTGAVAVTGRIEGLVQVIGA